MEGVGVFGIVSELCAQHSMNIRMHVCMYVLCTYVCMYVLCTYIYICICACNRKLLSIRNKVLQN
jgi:Na+/H+-dicarboxylate symporter